MVPFFLFFGWVGMEWLRTVKDLGMLTSNNVSFAEHIDAGFPPILEILEILEKDGNFERAQKILEFYLNFAISPQNTWFLLKFTKNTWILYRAGKAGSSHAARQAFMTWGIKPGEGKLAPLGMWLPIRARLQYTRLKMNLIAHLLFV